MARSWLRGLTPYTKCTVVPRLSYGKEGSASRRNNMGSTGTGTSSVHRSKKGAEGEAMCGGLSHMGQL